MKHLPSSADKIKERDWRPTSLLRWTGYGLGRLLQLLAMWLLLVALITAGPYGPSPRLFGAGIAMFVAGWGLVKLVVRRRA